MPVAQCREAGALPSPRKAAAAALAVGEVAALVHGVVLVLLSRTHLAGAMSANRTRAWSPLAGKSPPLLPSAGRWRLTTEHPPGVIPTSTARLSTCGIATIPIVTQATAAHLPVRMVE